MTTLTIESVAEASPGPAWAGIFERLWPAYREWYSRGEHARPSRQECEGALRRHMPELLPTYASLVALAGNDDTAARMLSLWRPPPFMAGCSQAVWTRSATPGPLVRNYEYAPELFEGILWRTSWHRPTLGMSDCLWGLLDGVNDAGLCVALAFGGRDALGEGFGIPLILRYLLETCATTAAACATLARLPVHMAYNVSLLDAAGDYAVAELGPDRPALIRREPVCANHQVEDAHPAGFGSSAPASVRRIATLPAAPAPQTFAARYAALTATHKRAELLRSLLAAPRQTEAGLVRRFLRPPLFSGAYRRGWGTLYTAAYRPAQRALSLHWPGAPTLTQSIASFTPGVHAVTLGR